MPEMDGLETTRTIRQRERSTGAHLPIVALTAHALRADEKRCLAAGMDAYMSKPIQPDALFETIERITRAQLQEPDPNEAVAKRTCDRKPPTVRR
jgi:two-component system, sensor histidine kinase and response regulator